MSWISGISSDNIQPQINQLKKLIQQLDAAEKALEVIVDNNVNAIAEIEEDINVLTANVETNTEDIAQNTEAISALETDVEANTEAISALETDVEANTEAISALETDVEANTEAISALETDVETNAEDIDNLYTMISLQEFVYDVFDFENPNRNFTTLYSNNSDIIKMIYDEDDNIYKIFFRKQDGNYISLNAIINNINEIAEQINGSGDDVLSSLVDTAQEGFDILDGLGSFASAGAGFVGGLIASSLSTSKGDGLFLLSWINVLRIAVGNLINVLEGELIHRLHKDRVIKIYSRNLTQGDPLDLTVGEAFSYVDNFKPDDAGDLTEFESRGVVFQGEEILTLGNELTEAELDANVFGNTPEDILDEEGNVIETNYILRDYKIIFKGKCLFMDDVVLQNYYNKTHIDDTFYDKTHIDDTFYDKTHIDDTFYNKTHIDDTFYDKEHIDTAFAENAIPKSLYDLTSNVANAFDTKSDGWILDINSTAWSPLYHINDVGYIYTNTSGVNLAGNEEIIYDVPSEKSHMYINHLSWSNCGYFDVYGLVGSTWIFICRINNFNPNTANATEHSGVMINEVGGVDRFLKIRINARKGRIHLMGIGWSELKHGITNGGFTGYLHWDNLSGNPKNINISDTDNSAYLTLSSGLQYDTLPLLWYRFDDENDLFRNYGRAGRDYDLTTGTATYNANAGNDALGDGYINIAANTRLEVNIENLQINHAIRGITVCFWARVSDKNINRGFFQFANASGRNGMLMWIQDSGSKLYRGVTTNDTGGASYSLTSAFTPVGIFDNGWSIYSFGINFPVAYEYWKSGSSRSQNTRFSANFNPVVPTALYIGYARWNNTYLNGDLDDFRVYDRILSYSEIEEIYNRRYGTNYYPEDDAITLQPNIIFKNNGGNNNIGLYVTNNDFVISNSSSFGSDIVFKTGSTVGYLNGTERMRIKANGDINISGNVNAASVDVTGNLNVEGVSTLNTINVTDTLTVLGNLEVQGQLVAVDTTSSLNLEEKLFINNKEALRATNLETASDTWLRLNQAQQFTSGVYTPSDFRCDGIIRLSGKRAFTGSDTFLRLNNNQEFTSGVYTPLALRCDGVFECRNNINCANGGVYMLDGKQALKDDGNFLKINDNGNFTNGVQVSSDFTVGSLTTTGLHTTLYTTLSVVNHTVLHTLDTTGNINCTGNITSSGAINGASFWITGSGTINGEATIGTLFSNSVCRRSVVDFTTDVISFQIIYFLNFRDYVNTKFSGGESVWVFRTTTFQSAGDFGDGNVHSSANIFFISTFAGYKARNHILYEQGQGGWSLSSSSQIRFTLPSLPNRSFTVIIESLT